MTAKAKRYMKRSNTKWEPIELAWIRTATLMGGDIYSQVDWLYNKRIKGRTRKSIFRRIQKGFK